MRRAVAACCFLLVPACAFSQSFQFEISMPRAAEHVVHVKMRCEGLSGEYQDFKMPAWMPGYYRLMDYAKNVADFQVKDGVGRALAWEKVTRNTWRVATGAAPAVILEYDVTGTVSFVAQSFVGDRRAYLAPPGLFLHVPGQLGRPATVTVLPPAGWERIATGLDRVAGRANTFSAVNFDVLYDAPILMGNQEALRFEVKGVPHFVALENVPASVDRTTVLADLARIVEAAAAMMGELPYAHYTFLMMGAGNGGIEHLNSASIAFNGNSLTTPDGYRGWLSYVAHEYFHNFNVKRIRPIALGPFDYDRENLTNMLWVSEGLSVYYQDLLLVRSALATREQYLAKMGAAMARFANAPGHLYQSATEASFNTWGNSGVGTDRNTTISYYDNGAMLGAMLDLAIRRESHDRQSLDDVMRVLYRTYYREKQRGFTDAEFRQACETAAGASLNEIFEYASAPMEMDYAKYFAYAGLAVEATASEGKGAYAGIHAQAREGGLAVVDVEGPARQGLRAGDMIVEVEGAKATVKALHESITGKQAGDKLHLKTARGEVELELAIAPKWTFAIRPVGSPAALQSEILDGWLRTR
ncbi:MAG TPA: PDZ domain-containing protein [Candidatus Solibacter sp.]